MTSGQPTPNVHLTNTADYQPAPDAVTIQNFQGIYMSPPQAKALFNILQQNLKQYEAAFGEIRLEAHGQAESIQ
jgi:hypothetical protein